MSRSLRIVMGQLNLLVGDIDGNADKLIRAANRARDEIGGDLIVFPELALTGYPPEDLLLRADLLERAEKGLAAIAGAVHGVDVIIGHPHRRGDRLYNAASVVHNGKIIATYLKQLLPNYGVFDEKRYFAPGNNPCVIDIHG
ncbi:MAG: NAD+ synthase, partial [Nitrospira sp.]|nr:NAD+ synthase [Nitrospira sp.]